MVVTLEVSEEPEVSEDRAALELAVVRGLRQCDGELDVLEQVVANRLGLSRTDARALEIIDRRRGITPGELARALGYSPSAVTVVINRLESAELVDRSLSERDRRRLALQATARGRRLVGRFMRDFGERLTATLAEMSAGDLAAVAHFLDACSATAAEYRRGVSGPGPG